MRDDYQLRQLRRDLPVSLPQKSNDLGVLSQAVATAQDVLRKCVLEDSFAKHCLAALLALDAPIAPVRSVLAAASH